MVKDYTTESTKKLQETLDAHDWLVEHCEGKSYGKAKIAIDSIRAELEKRKDLE